MTASGPHRILDNQNASAVEAIGDLGALGLPAFLFVQEDVEIAHGQGVDGSHGDAVGEGLS